MLITVNICS